jgi:hypothetical protein
MIGLGVHTGDGDVARRLAPQCHGVVWGSDSEMEI